MRCATRTLNCWISDMATVNEQLRDEAISHAIGINRFGTGIANRMLKILNASDADISAKLIVALENLSPESFTVRRLESLLGDVRSLNRQAIDSMFSAMSGELHALAGYEAGYQISLFDSLLPDIVLKRYPLQDITADMVYAATMSQPFQGRLLSEWAEGLETDRMTRIVNAVRHGYLQGETTEAIARMVRGHANKVYKDGALQMSRANATSIVKSAVTGVTLSETKLDLNAGETAQLVAEVTPADAINKQVIWSSSNEEVAKVSADGLVTAMAGVGGTTIITCTTVDGGKTATCEVTETVSLDKLFISHPSATYFMKAANTYWRAGITQGALLIVDCSSTPCDGSVVVCKLAGEFHIRRFRTHPYKHLESLSSDGRKDRISTDDDDGIFGVILHAVNDMRMMEFDDNPVM